MLMWLVFTLAERLQPRRGSICMKSQLPVPFTFGHKSTFAVAIRCFFHNSSFNTFFTSVAVASDAFVGNSINFNIAERSCGGQPPPHGLTKSATRDPT